MKRTLVLTSAVLAWAGISLGAGLASAAPGDAIAVTGTVQQERADGLVLRGADGATYFADLRRASGREDFNIGEAVRVVGHEGRRPGEIIVSSVEPAARAGRMVRGPAPSGDALELEAGCCRARTSIRSRTTAACTTRSRRRTSRGRFAGARKCTT